MDSTGRKLEKMQARFFPPGIILEFGTKYGDKERKSINLFNLSNVNDIPFFIRTINEQEPLTIKTNDKIKKVLESKNIYTNNIFLINYRISRSNFRQKRQKIFFKTYIKMSRITFNKLCI